MHHIGRVFVEFRVWSRFISLGGITGGGLGDLPDIGALSSSSFPNEISLIALGLVGFVSHSMHESVIDFISHQTQTYHLSIPAKSTLSVYTRSNYTDHSPGPARFSDSDTYHPT